MISISRKTIYGVAALYQLSLQKKDAQLSIKEIALTLENSIDPAPCKTGNPVLDHFWKERHREAMHTMDILLSQLDGHHVDPTTIHEEKRETPYEI